jgi:hypothetical protein
MSDQTPKTQNKVSGFGGIAPIEHTYNVKVHAWLGRP